MIPVGEFYRKPHTEQQKLVDDGHVVVNGEIANTIPSATSRGGVFVFDEPVTDLVVDQLKGAQYTANEIEPEFPIGKEEITDLFGWMKYQPLDLLADHYGVLRVADTEGTEYVYTVEVVPFQARCIDPTLSGYLLDADDDNPISRPTISTERDHGAFEEYLEQSTKYWDIPRDELKTQLNQDAGFAMSTLGPLAVATEFPDSERIIDRFKSVADSYQRKRHDVNRVKKNISFHKACCRRNPSLAAFQSFSLYLFDVNQYATIENDHQLRELVAQGGEVLYRCLYGNLWPGGQTPWQPFRVTINDELETSDRRVIDVVQHQPTSNGMLADRWEFDERRNVSDYLKTEFDQYATRNSDGFICATESARRFVITLEENGRVELSKSPPRVPARGNITLEVSDTSKGMQGSGVDWTKD